MKPLQYGKNFLFVLLSCFPLLSAERVTIEDHEGESFIFTVDPEDSFLDLVESINAFKGKVIEDAGEIQTFKVSVARNEMVARRVARAIPRNYSAGISATESADIAFILKTMANSSLPKIKAAETDLKKAGVRIDHVHPYYFLSCIFTNEELIVCVRNLQGRAFVWKEFLRGVVDSFDEENARGNVLQFAPDFATRVKVDSNAIVPIIQAGRWERLVNTLIDIVPREGGTDRYNM